MGGAAREASLFPQDLKRAGRRGDGRRGGKKMVEDQLMLFLGLNDHDGFRD